MTTLSSPIENIQSHYQVLVIGSGYGGGISASRMARAGFKVCLLERGKEYQSGEFPDTLAEGMEAIQVDAPLGHVGSRTGLYDFHVNDDMNVLVGCGLGGTSLINANVSIKPDPRVFEDPRWPQGLLADKDDGLQKGYEEAHRMLKPNPYPGKNEDYPALKKLDGMEKSGAAMGEPFRKLDINVTFEKYNNETNHVGVQQKPCNLCGDCVSGCNHTSKNTTQMNYLPDAWNHGAEIFTEVKVLYVEKSEGKWLIHYEPVDSGQATFGAPPQFVSADIVVLSAGTLGSSEILLRSQAKGLSLSKMLGQHFTGNGDVLGFGYNNDQAVNAVGYGSHSPDPENPAGPCITGIVDTRSNAENYKDGMSIEEGVIPGALATVLPTSFSSISKFLGQDTDEGFFDYLAEKKRELESLLRGAYSGAIKNTQVYLVMTHDSADGVMTLEDDRLRIQWPGVGKEEIFKKVEKRLIQMTKALGGTFIPNPIWTKFLGHELVTVHPLGGCVMGDDASAGVVNHKGQVFSGHEGEAIHEGLYVADGSIIPTSLGTNPLFTISAISERNAALMAEAHGKTVTYHLPSRPSRTPAPTHPGLQFTETMSGTFTPTGKTPAPFQFTLTVVSQDAHAMMTEKDHPAMMHGTVKAPGLSSEPLNVSQGKFHLFSEDPDRVETRQMTYQMVLKSVEGKSYFFYGYKSIHDDPGLDLWSDTTTLHVTIHEGDHAETPLLGQGTLFIKPTDFAKQMTTLKVPRAKDLAERLKIIAQFGKLFAGELFDVYGGLARDLEYFHSHAPPRKRRPLRVNAPEVHEFKTEDNVQLRLTRYEHGTKGPVILSHGLGVSSRIFSTDTIDTNLLEYLAAHHYDVWLLDYRASVELPASQGHFTADDVARYDYPAAVNKVLEITGAPDVQMVVHCFGSTCWSLSMLGGWLTNVRSAVCSQVSTHMQVPFLSKVKAGLHLPTFLDKLGVDSLTAYVDDRSSWSDKFFDQALKLYPIEKEERCNSATCHRITFLYGHLYEHDQLNELCHHNLHELYGVANIASLEHLALMARRGHVVDAHGDELYLPHLERMALPITFISGGENQCFLPESTETTYKLLRQKNGKSLYKRFVIPNYGHIDCIHGRDASRDVFPFILEQLENT